MAVVLHDIDDILGIVTFSNMQHVSQPAELRMQRLPVNHVTVSVHIGVREWVYQGSSHD